MSDIKASPQVTSSKIPKRPFVPSSFREELLGELKGSPLSVYLAYLSYANTEGIAWPSLRTLVAVTRYGINAVKDARRKLIAMGLLVVVDQARSDGRFGLKRFQICTVARKPCHGTVAPSTVARCTVARKQCQEGTPSEGSPSEVSPVDAVRRPIDAKLRVPKRVFSPSEKKQKLRAHLAAKIEERGDSFARHIDYCKNKGLEHPWGKAEQEAFAAMAYKPDLNDPYLTLDFVDDVLEVRYLNRDKDVSPGNLCSKVIDFCERERKSSGGHYVPPDFVEHRNQLRVRERVHEAPRPSEEMRA